MPSTALGIAYAWLGVGLLCTAWFQFRGTRHFGRPAEEATWSFRLLMIPSLTLLWPLLLVALRRKASHRSSARS